MSSKAPPPGGFLLLDMTQNRIGPAACQSLPGIRLVQGVAIATAAFGQTPRLFTFG